MKQLSILNDWSEINDLFAESEGVGKYNQTGTRYIPA